MKSMQPLSVAIFLPPANEVCEGYVFTAVCLSMGGGAVVDLALCLRGASLSVGGSVRGVGPCPEGGSLSRGSLSREVSVRKTPPGQRPPYGNKWAVHILLECIFVYYLFLQRCGGGIVPSSPPPIRYCLVLDKLVN